MPTSAIDTALFRGVFGSAEMRRTWSDEIRTQAHLGWEIAMMALAPRMGCDQAHDAPYGIVHAPDGEGKGLADLLLANEESRRQLGEEEMRRLCEPANYLGLAGPMVDRVLAG